MQTFWGRGPIAFQTAAVCLGASVLYWPCEGAVEPGAESVGVTQAVIEVVTPRPPATILVDHSIIEIVRPDIVIPEEEEDDDRGVIGPIRWLEWPRHGGSPVITDLYSDLDLQDPSDYYGGYKPALLASAGEATRVLSDMWTGDWQGGQFNVKVIDRLHEITRRKADPDARFWTTPLTFRMINRAARARQDTPWTVWIGSIINAQPADGFHWDLTLGDIISETLLSDSHQVPWRVVGDGLINVLDEIDKDLDLQTPEPIIYGNHFRVPDVDPASPQGFVYKPTLLGTRTVDGTPYYVWMIAGHACKDVPAIRIDDVVTPEGSDWLIPTQGGHTGVFGTSFEDIESASFPGVFRRYTLLYGVVGNTDPDAVANGEKKLTVHVSGVETVGNGTGALITDRFQQYKHFCINFVANYGPDSYQSGSWLTNPHWNIFDADVPIVHTATFNQCTSIGSLRLPDNDGYIGAAIIGAEPGSQASVRKWLADWNRSCGCQFGITHRGRIAIYLLHPTDEIKANAPVLTDAYEILRDSFSTRFDWTGQANQIRFRGDYEYADGRWRTEGVAINQNSVDGYGAIPSPLREFPFAPGITALNHLAVLEGRVRAHPPQIVTLEATIGPDPVTGASLGYAELGDYRNYVHVAAVGTERQVRLGQVIGHSINTDTRTVQVTLLDCEDLIGFDEFEGDFDE